MIDVVISLVTRVVVDLIKEVSIVKLLLPLRVTIIIEQLCIRGGLQSINASPLFKVVVTPLAVVVA